MPPLPKDLVDFLTAGRQLVFDPIDSEVGEVTLIGLKELKLSLFSMNGCDTQCADEDPHRDESGCYLVEGVDLIREATGGYDPQGLLIWLPLDQCFGAWDSSHNMLYVFDAATTWTDIAAAPTRYLNAQWQSDSSAPVSELKPWLHHPYNAVQLYRRLDYPTRWFTAKQKLRGKNVNGVQLRYPWEVTLQFQSEPTGCRLTTEIRRMDDLDTGLEWQSVNSSSRVLTAAEEAALWSAVEPEFWVGGKLGTDYGESLIIWSMEGVAGKRYGQVTRFYSEQPQPDRISQLGSQLLQLAGVAPLEKLLN